MADWEMKPENSISADKMVLELPKKMSLALAEQVMAYSKIYSKKAFPEGMIDEAKEVLREHTNSGRT